MTRAEAEAVIAYVDAAIEAAFAAREEGPDGYRGWGSQAASSNLEKATQHLRQSVEKEPG